MNRCSFAAFCFLKEIIRMIKISRIQSTNKLFYNIGMVNN